MKASILDNIRRVLRFTLRSWLLNGEDVWAGEGLVSFSKLITLAEADSSDVVWLPLPVHSTDVDS